MQSNAPGTKVIVVPSDATITDVVRAEGKQFITFHSWKWPPHVADVHVVGIDKEEEREADDAE